ncbi:unnamed protein product [Clonostachys byssicola]|uniref:AB hydrolase-1 domain-containing protein n=1 Tax=Clonostachys byssicola TaxID=160290 RepID=A0A9N9V121_9HYPO|nr:unnamed protein product [Clonostachys byssicola]
MGQHGKYTNSLQIAADMDAIRKGLGQDTLNFWGLSYGGVLGHTYSVLFPDRVGHVILDGSLHPWKWFSHRAFGRDARSSHFLMMTRLRAEALSIVEKIEALKTPTKVRLNSTHHGLIGRLDLWTKGIIPAMGSPLKWHDFANRLASLMRGDAKEAFLAYGTYDEPPFDGLEMNDYHDLVALNDAADGEWNGEDWTDAFTMSKDITAFLTAYLVLNPTYLVEFERFLQATQWRNTLTNPAMRGHRPEEEPGTPMLFISTGEPYLDHDLSRLASNEWLVVIEGGHGGHTSISMPSKCAALAIREYLDGRPPTSQVVSEWESHVCRVDGPEFVHPDELETNAREIVGDNEEDVRLYLAQVALARDTNWRVPCHLTVPPDERVYQEHKAILRRFLQEHQREVTVSTWLLNLGSI